jgi:hypothetical protein
MKENKNRERNKQIFTQWKISFKGNKYPPREKRIKRKK